jgi:hypothetical protein
MVLVIEKQVPVPTRRPRGMYSAVVSKMEVGDSVVIPIKHYGVFFHSSRRASKIITTRKVDSEHMRVWVTKIVLS